MSSGDRETLARWRQIGAKQSQEVLAAAPKLLRSSNLGEEEWSLREQLAFAALDLGRVEVATEQIAALNRRFPNSPRVAILKGMKLECMDNVEGAKRIYEGILIEDETNIVCWETTLEFTNNSAHQRLITISLESGPSISIPKILEYLDTFYTDAAAWSLLADLYIEQGLCGQGLTCLGHVMIINSWDSGSVAKAGEVAYTMGDYQLALKHFLRALEMQSAPTDVKGSLKGKDFRIWQNIHQCTSRLIQSPESNGSLSAELCISDDKVKSLQELASGMLLSLNLRTEA